MTEPAEVLDRMLGRRRCPNCGAVDPDWWHSQGQKCSECPLGWDPSMKLKDYLKKGKKK